MLSRVSAAHRPLWIHHESWIRGALQIQSVDWARLQLHTNLHVPWAVLAGVTHVVTKISHHFQASVMLVPSPSFCTDRHSNFPRFHFECYAIFFLSNSYCLICIHQRTPFFSHSCTVPPYPVHMSSFYTTTAQCRPLPTQMTLFNVNFRPYLIFTGEQLRFYINILALAHMGLLLPVAPISFC